MPVDMVLCMLHEYAQEGGRKGGALTAVPKGKPIRVAIIGGGCASIAAAFELSRPEHNRKYQITVYQLGWRLGGKGASGRGPSDRIEEHGFHVWMGCYENAFRLMRECYSELKRDRRICGITDWRDAFFPAPLIGLAQSQPHGGYHNFLSYFPPGDGLPGDPLTHSDNPFSVSSYLARIASLLRTMLLTTRASSRLDDAAGRDGETPEERVQWASSDASPRIARLLKLGLLATTAGLIEAFAILEIAFSASAPGPRNLLVKLLESLAAMARQQVERLIDDDPEMLLFWQAMDLSITGMLGIVRFGVISDPRGFDAINEYDFREWMRINGISERSIESPLVRAAYDLVFAYEDGDYQRPRHGAGVMLRGALRMLFTSRGAIFWKMRAAMGDVVFAPFYEVLKRRGVTFEFFHRLERVRLSESESLARSEGSYVDCLEFDLQATAKQGEYHPLVNVRGLPCWPSMPDYSQLVDGERLESDRRDFESHWDRRKVGTKTLRVTKDFDFVVLGVGFGAIPYVCRDFIERDRRWRALVTRVKSVETQVFQLWLRDEMHTFGWNEPSVSLSAFVHPFETWADMGHLAKAESWKSPPRAIAYFCSVLKGSNRLPTPSETKYAAERRREVYSNAIQFLNKHIGELWPNARGASRKFKWETLMDPYEVRPRKKKPIKGEARFDSQYWRANVNPTDRYVLSLPGTQKYRISPLDNTYDNFTVAGDWTACGLDTGCVEAAVIAGRLAAYAISSSPRLEDIVGYDHP